MAPLARTSLELSNGNHGTSGAQHGKNGLMGSELVCHVFNTCADDRYHITYRDRPMRSEPASQTGETVDTDELEKALTSAEAYFSGKATAANNVKSSLLEKVLVDAFTPGDIKASFNTSLKGRLRKGLG